MNAQETIDQIAELFETLAPPDTIECWYRCDAMTHGEVVAHLRKELKTAETERDEARDWVRKLTAETRVLTCVYCGHAYPPGTPDHGDSKLTEHIAVCEKHPLRAAEARIAELEQDRYHVWMRGFQAKTLGKAPRESPFPEPPITVGPLPLPEKP